MVWDPANNLFLGSDFDSDFLTITTTGVVTDIGDLTNSYQLRGLAFFGPNVSSIPETPTLALMGLGLAGIGYRRRQLRMA
jgi:hypothetical protein